MKHSIESYIAINNPSATVSVLNTFGVPSIKGGDTETLLKRVHEATIKIGLPFLKKMAKVDTPYRSLILSEAIIPVENTSNCCGINGEHTSECSGGCSSNKSNTVGEHEQSRSASNGIGDGNGETQKKLTNVLLSEKVQLVGMGIVGAIIVSLILKK